MAAEPPAAGLARRACAIYVVDIEGEMGMALPERYRPLGWETNKFSAELWLRRAIEHHPWRVRDPSEADLVLLSANFSLYCRAGKSFTGRAVWAGLVSLLGHTGNRDCRRCKPLLGLRNGTAKFITLTNNECKAPWTGAVKPRDVFAVSDQKPGAFGVLAPFVVAKPAWLTAPLGALGAPRRVPWAERKLLFFLGHVPKLYIEPTRYRIWSQVQRLPLVTALSGTLNCSVGQFSACTSVDSLTDEQLRTFCYDFCRAHAEEGAAVQRNEEPGMKKWRRAGNRSISELVKMRCKSRSSLRRYCKAHKRVNFTEELPDMAAAARKLPQDAYYKMAMGHRFCLAAPGDFVSTPKITEFVALGAVGGCLPLLVIKGEPHNTLPYMRWLDWCSLAYIVNASRTWHMSDVVAKLRAVSAQEAAAKHAALRRVADAFVWRRPARQPLEQPSAADYILADACDSWRRFRSSVRANKTKVPTRTPKHSKASRGKGRRLLEEPSQGRAAGGQPFIDVRRCML